MSRSDVASAPRHISVPKLLGTRSLEADHLTRYQWAAQFAGERRVLVAGCGDGRGCALIAEAGAREVVGVDAAEAVIEAAAPDMPDRVRLAVGDVRALRYPSGAFELVVCFGVLEHVEDPELVLDELVRVLADDGLLVVSASACADPPAVGDSAASPPQARGMAPALAAFSRDELVSAVSTRLEHFRILLQAPLLGSAIVPQDRDLSQISEARPSVLSPGEFIRPMCLIVLATRASPADPSPLLGLAGRLDLDAWVAALEAAEERARHSDELVRRLSGELRDLQLLQQQLLEAEQRSATAAELELQNDELRTNLDARERELQLLRDRLAGSEQVLRDVVSSASWRITEPLRVLKRVLRR